MTNAPVLAAEYTNGSKRRPAVLTINEISAGQRRTLRTEEVSGKREARAIARTFGAPETVPIGSVAARASSGVLSGVNSPATVLTMCMTWL